MLCGVAFIIYICYNLENVFEVIIVNEVMYCEKCGYVGHIMFNKKCKNCKLKMKLLPEKIKYKYHIFVEDWAQISDEEIISREKDFVIGELKNTPIFSMKEYQKQVQKQLKINYELDEWHKKRDEEYRNKILNKNLVRIQKESDKVNCVPKCPICGSSNIHKITVGTRAVKTAAFGVVGAVDDAGKTYKCGNCGSKF